MLLKDPTGGIPSPKQSNQQSQPKDTEKFKDPTGGLPSPKVPQELMRPLTEFHIGVESRFRKSERHYNKKTHKYDQSYIKPKTWKVMLDARPALRQLTSPSTTPPGGKFPGTTPDNLPELDDFEVDLLEPEPVQFQKLELPDGVLSYEWRIEKIGGGFSQVILKDRSMPASLMAQAEFDVPSEGKYSCELTIRGKNNFSASQKATINIRDFLVVSIGASYGSGEGNPDIPGRPKEFDPDFKMWDVILPHNIFIKLSEEAIDWGWDWLKLNATTLSAKFDATIEMDPRPIWLELNAHRSMLSGHARGARRIEEIKPGEANLVTYLNFCRSGSTIPNGLIDGRSDGKDDGWIGGRGQLEELQEVENLRAIDALIIDIGGNDVGFSGGLEDLTKAGFGGDDISDKDSGDVEEEFDIKLKELESVWFPKLKDELDKLPRIHNIFLTEYPIAMFEKMVNEGPGGAAVPKPAKGCEIFFSEFFDLDITTADAELIQEMGTKLNEALKRVANRNKWIFVDGIADGFSGKGYCAGSGRMYVMASESFVIQGDKYGTMHPNREGHIWIGQQVAEHLRKHLIDPNDPVLNADTFDKVKK